MAIELLEVRRNQLEVEGFEQEELETLLEYICVILVIWHLFVLCYTPSVVSLGHSHSKQMIIITVSSKHI